MLTTWEKDPTSVPRGPLGIIAMAGCEELGEKINQWLLKWHSLQETQDEEYYTSPGVDRDTFLIKSSCPRFGTGEGKAVLRESVRGYDIFIIVDCFAHNVTYRMYGQDVPLSPDDHFQDLKRVIAAISGRAKRITVIMPMLYEGRQHRRTTRESLDCAIFLQELVNMGINDIITFDAHDPRMVNAVPLSGFENVMPTYQMLKALCRVEKELRIDKDHMMVVSPDEGAVQRNIYYSSILSLDMGMFYKRRDYTTVVNGRNPIVAHEYLGADVEGKDILVADDMLASGDSMIDVCRELKARKANRIYALTTFALFTSGPEAFRKAWEEGIITKVIAADLTYCAPEIKEEPWFALADMSKYISYLIATLNHDRSLHGLLNPYNRIKALLQRYREEQAAMGITMV
ncbi:MAG: ribose-phosphate pyrophosphokinase [Clostridia bacterium]|nr:ribose-phosphate pyrophosphokinase [Clostridia bacterium]